MVRPARAHIAGGMDTTCVSVVLSQTVAWSSVRAPWWSRAAEWVPCALFVGLGLLMAPFGGSDGGAVEGPQVVDPELGMEPLGTVAICGRGAGLPAAFPEWRSVDVHLQSATIEPGLRPLVLPLADMTIVEARRIGLRWVPRKAANARWLIRATGPDIDVTFAGAWLLLAHLGTLGGWPEPT